MSFASLHPVSLSSRSVASLSWPNPAFSSICNSRLVLMTGGKRRSTTCYLLYPRNSRSLSLSLFLRFIRRLHAIAVLSVPFHYLINIMELFVCRLNAAIASRGSAIANKLFRTTAPFDDTKFFGTLSSRSRTTTSRLINGTRTI